MFRPLRWRIAPQPTAVAGADRLPDFRPTPALPPVRPMPYRPRPEPLQKCMLTLGAPERAALGLEAVGALPPLPAPPPGHRPPEPAPPRTRAGRAGHPA